MSKIIDTGIVIVDKPKGISSHEVSERIKQIFNAKKAGHSGTLDPYVTGVLIVALNNATPLLNYLIKKDKTYEGYLRFSKNITKKKAQEIFNKFIGEIEQMPPRKCAVKRQMRKKHVYSFKAIKKIKTETNKADIYFKIKCEAGTYIRSLARDISDKYSTCRLMTLRRTAVGDIKQNKAHTIEKIKKDLEKTIIPAKKIIKKEMPYIIADKLAINSLLNGHPLYIPGVLKIYKKFNKGEIVAVFNEKNELVEIAEAMETSENIKKLKKGIAVKPIRVIMKKSSED